MADPNSVWDEVMKFLSLPESPSEKSIRYKKDYEEGRGSVPAMGTHAGWDTYIAKITARDYGIPVPKSLKDKRALISNDALLQKMSPTAYELNQRSMPQKWQDFDRQYPPKPKPMTSGLVNGPGDPRTRKWNPR